MELSDIDIDWGEVLRTPLIGSPKNWEGEFYKEQNHPLKLKALKALLQSKPEEWGLIQKAWRVGFRSEVTKHTQSIDGDYQLGNYLMYKLFPDLSDAAYTTMWVIREKP